MSAYDEMIDIVHRVALSSTHPRFECHRGHGLIESFVPRLRPYVYRSVCPRTRTNRGHTREHARESERERERERERAMTTEGCLAARYGQDITEAGVYAA